MGIVLNLESFDKLSNASSSDVIPVPATYEDGFQDGLEQAAATLETEQSSLRVAVVESLSDQAFGFQEAQNHYLGAMQSFVAAVLDVIIPETLSTALHLQVRSMLLAALQQDAEQQMELRLPPDQVAPCEAIIADLDLSGLRIEADASLSDHAALLSGSFAETSIDLDQLRAAIKVATSIILQPSTEVS